MKNNTKYELHLGDCLESLKNMPDNSVDSVITDHVIAKARIEHAMKPDNNS